MPSTHTFTYTYARAHEHAYARRSRLINSVLNHVTCVHNAHMSTRAHRILRFLSKTESEQCQLTMAIDSTWQHFICVGQQYRMSYKFESQTMGFDFVSFNHRIILNATKNRIRPVAQYFNCHSMRYDWIFVMTKTVMVGNN